MRECERKVFLYSGYTDMRLGVYGLIRKIGKPEDGGFYAFCGKTRKTVKILEYHSHYVWLHTKKVLSGKMSWPLSGDISTVDMSALRLLIDNIDVINRVELKDGKTLHTF